MEAEAEAEAVEAALKSTASTSLRATAVQNEPIASTPAKNWLKELVLIQVLSFEVGDQLHCPVSYGRSFSRTPMLFGPEPQQTVDVDDKPCQATIFF